MKNIITILISSICCAGISFAGNLLENGNAEAGPCLWNGQYNILTDKVFHGKYSFVLEIGADGRAEFSPAGIIPLNNLNTLYFSGVMRAQSSGNSCVSVKLALFDDYAMPYDKTAVSPIKGSECMLLKAALPGDKKI